MAALSCVRGHADSGRVTVFAAASTAEVMKELSEDYVKSSPGVEFTLNFASSGALARQIEHGASADVYVSANPDWAHYLDDAALLDSSSLVELMHNKLVVVGWPGAGVTAMDGLASLERIAVGSPDSVPAGKYAKSALERAGLYAKLSGEGRLVPAKDVRHALLYAERGEVGAAFVYATDAKLAVKAGVLFEVDPSLYPRITYPAAITARGAANSFAVSFMRYLRSPAAAKIMERYGFTPVAGN